MTGARSPGGRPSSPTRILVRITANPGESFLDRMIGLVEGASRQKTPNEIALHILLVGLTPDLPLRLRHPGCHRGLLGHPALGDRRDRPARLPHPHHHRGAALRHRHRRHGPPPAQERAGHERAGRGGGRRRGRPAPRQDRDHHAGQPHGGRLRPGRRRPPVETWRRRRSWPAWPTRRPRGAPSWSSRSSASFPARPGPRGPGTLGPLHGADPHERLRPGATGSSARGRWTPSARHVAIARRGAARGPRGRGPAGSATPGAPPLAVSDGARGPRHRAS